MTRSRSRCGASAAGRARGPLFASVLLAALAPASSAFAAQAETTAPAASAAQSAAAKADARIELARHAAFIGSRETIAKTSTFHITGRVQAFGLSGSIEAFVEGPRNMVQTLDLGAIKQTTGWSEGRNAWGVDPNGKTRSLEGNERAAIITEAWFTSLAYLGAADAPQNDVVELVSAGADTVRIAITPPGGRERVLALDARTGELLLAAEIQDIDTMTVFYSDYRDVDGLRLPFRARQTTGNPAYDVTIELDAITRNAPVDPALFRAPDAAPRDVRFARGDRAERIPIEVSGSHILTSVFVNGRGPYDFFIDTGAGATCVDAALAESLGLASQGAVEAKGVGGTTTVSYARVDSLGVRGATLLSQAIVALPLANIGALMGRHLAGILGYDFFSRFVVRIDYEKGTMSLFDPAGFEPPRRATSLPITLEANVPAVEGVVSGRHKGLFRIDTGSGSSLDLHGPFVAEHRLMDSARRVVHRPFAGVGGMHLGAVARLDTFAIGTFVMTDLVTGLSEATEGAFASASFAGNIGGGILRRFTVTLDYEGKRIFLEPNARFGERDTFDRSGMALTRDGDALRAEHVEEGAPAWRAGVRPGDHILSVNGKPSARWRDEDLSQALRAKPGKTVRVRLERDGKVRTISFRLEEIL